jgi:hypothetical protein
MVMTWIKAVGVTGQDLWIACQRLVLHVRLPRAAATPSSTPSSTKYR